MKKTDDYADYRIQIITVAASLEARRFPPMVDSEKAAIELCLSFQRCVLYRERPHLSSSGKEQNVSCM